MPCDLSHLGIRSNQGFGADNGNDQDSIEQQTDQADVEIWISGNHNAISSQSSSETESSNSHAEA
jgi:hypothetical protein